MPFGYDSRLLLVKAWRSAARMRRVLSVDRLFYKLDKKCPYHGGNLVAQTLRDHNVKQVFTLTGGHIAPILTACSESGIRVIDTRHEASAAFAADAACRLSGVPGVCVVTAGPGLTNTVTAVKNARSAESAMLVIAGAAPTLLKGRGSLQDMDQLSVFRSICKGTVRVTRVRDIQEELTEALCLAVSGTPGPVLVEIPVDILYPYHLVKEMAGVSDSPRGLMMRYISFTVDALFAGVKQTNVSPLPVPDVAPNPLLLSKMWEFLTAAKKPVMVIGSQALLPGGKLAAEKLSKIVQEIGIPVFLGGMSRGLLGAEHPLFLRQQRRQALKEADVIILAGAVCDFRLDYGRNLNRKAKVIIINRDSAMVELNEGMFWRSACSIEGDVISTLSVQKGRVGYMNVEEHHQWLDTLRQREDEAEVKMLCDGESKLEGGVNAVQLFTILDRVITDNSVLIGDGGDFVGTASKILRPRKPLSWLDPGPYGTLGVGGGFALGVSAVSPTSEVWVLWGDGSSCYSLAEVEAAVRHNLPFIAVIGNDGSWGQIARDQTVTLGGDIGCVLNKETQYHTAAEGYGAVGMFIGADATEEEIEKTFQLAQADYRDGKTVVINVQLGRSSFREGSISL